MTLPASSEPHLAPVITIPVFDDHRHLIVDWYERIGEGGARKAIPSVISVCIQLRRVRSGRQERLAEFLEQAVIAMQNDEIEGARYILLTALATFGWPSYLGA